MLGRNQVKRSLPISQNKLHLDSKKVQYKRKRKRVFDDFSELSTTDDVLVQQGNHGLKKRRRVDLDLILVILL